MKHSIIIFIICAVINCLSSCKKCKVCQCTKNGVQYEEKNCAYGGGSSNETLETWEKYLKEEKGYDTVVCETE